MLETSSRTSARWVPGLVSPVISIVSRARTPVAPSFFQNFRTAPQTVPSFLVRNSMMLAGCCAQPLQSAVFCLYCLDDKVTPGFSGTWSQLGLSFILKEAAVPAVLGVSVLHECPWTQEKSGSGFLLRGEVWCSSFLQPVWRIGAVFCCGVEAGEGAKRLVDGESRTWSRSLQVEECWVWTWWWLYVLQVLSM